MIRVQERDMRCADHRRVDPRSNVRGSIFTDEGEILCAADYTRRRQLAEGQVGRAYYPSPPLPIERQAHIAFELRPA